MEPISFTSYIFLAALFGSIACSIVYSLYRKFCPATDDEGNIVSGVCPYNFDSAFTFSK